MADAKKQVHGESEATAGSSRKQRLLIATDNFLPRWDGISRFLAEMIPRLKDKYVITVIAPDFGPSPADNAKSFKLVKMPLSKFSIGDFPISKPDKKKVLSEVKNADIVFTQTIGPIGLSVINAANKEGKEVVSYTHSIDWELATQALGVEFFKPQAYSVARSFVRRIYHKIDLLVVPAQSVAELFSWHQIETPKEVIHLGVDTKRFVPPSSRDDAKKLVGISKDIFVIGYHGRIGREKDLLTLLRAYIIIKKHYPKTMLLIVGDGLESIKRKLGSVRGVVLAGSKNNVVPYLQAMDVFCLTSLTETTSLSTLEAMACGVPAITNKVGFVKDYIKDRKNGIFFMGKDSYDLSRQVILLIKNQELRERIGATGRKFVEKNFDWDITAKGLDSVFQKMLK